MDATRSTTDSPTPSRIRPTDLPGGVGMFQSLRIRDFRLLWVANLIASFAMQMQMIARGWLIYDITSSPLALTWVVLSFMLPSFVFSLWGGVIADRVRKKPIMIGGQLVNAAATAALAAIVYGGDVTFWHFIYFGLFNGAIMSLSMPARAAVVPEIVPERIMVNAMALQSATYSGARVAGPALAGWLIAWFAGGDGGHGPGSSTTAVGILLYVIAAMYLVAVGATALLRYQGDPTPRPGAKMLDDIAEGFRYMGRERIVLGLLIMGIAPMMFGFAPSFLAPVFNKEVLDGNPQTLGYVMTAMGVGSLAGSLLLARLGDIGGKGRVMFACCYVWGIGIAGFALSPTLAVAMVFGVFIGIFGSVAGSLNMSVVTLAIAPEVRGRVMSIMMMSFGIMPIGMIPIAAAAEFTGIASALLGSAFLLAASMAVLGWCFPELRRIDKGHGGR